MRVDTYIWYLRYYKSRSQAISACRQGHVRIDDQIIKPSREVFVGDKIKVRKNQVWRELMVLDFPKSRVGAKIVNLYREDLTPKEAFKNTNFQSLSKTPKRDEGSGRPTKKDRREIDEYHENQKTK
jgi:ribosome-associated heat shock protein Hsp15|tara:strand:- start:79 stop:456 length:378 start_codon:yes stop_codon:yes gene_type:complete